MHKPDQVVAVGSVSTPLLRTLGPNTAGGSPAYLNHKKAHYNMKLHIAGGSNIFLLIVGIGPLKKEECQ